MSRRPYIWQMVRQAIEALAGEVTRSEMIEYVTSRYPGAKESSVSTHIITCTVNAPSRIHDPRNRRPRLADSRYDFLFRTGRGVVELYDPEKHGQWEIRRGADGDVVVALVGGREYPSRRKRKGPDAQAPRRSWTMPTKEEFLRGVEEYEKREKRDAMYKVATFVVSQFWGNPADVADGLGVLLLTWNQAFYRYGMFDFDRLHRCIEDNMEAIEGFRTLDISTLSAGDADPIAALFDQFLVALQIESGKSRGKRSPVAVAKALHLLGPSFFPLWDDKIAREYRCYYASAPAEKYVQFSRITKAIGDVVRLYTDRSDKTLVKLIDEYNYARFTRGWL